MSMLMHVCNAAELRLDKYYESVQGSADGVLSEEELEDLVRELREPELQHPLMELRARHLKGSEVTARGGYTALPNTAPPDPQTSRTAAFGVDH